MKITQLSAILLSLSLGSPVIGATFQKGHKCMARPGGHHRHGSGSVTASYTSTTAAPTGSTVNVAPPPPPKPSDTAPAPAPPAASPEPEPKPAPAPKPEPKPEPAPAPAPKPEPAPAPAAPALSSDEQAYLSAHNSIRSSKHAVALTWSDKLASYAQGVANTCVFKHSGGPYGENLSAGTHSFSIPAAIKLWTDEEKDYNPSNPQFSHYTQVVWKGSREVGCAKITCATLVDAFDVSVHAMCVY